MAGDSAGCLRDTADRTTVLRLLEDDLVWLQDSDHRA